MRKNEPLTLKEVIHAELFRARPQGGYLPPKTLSYEDLVVNDGRIFLAQRINGGDTVASAMAHTAVGTVSTAAALTDSGLTGEVSRKASAVSSAITNNIYTNIATFGGAAESITSVVLREAGVFNHALSGQGTMYQRVTFAAVTLADSDLFKITMETVVGSNTI